MAVRLSKGFGSTPETWLRIKMNFDLALVQQAAKDIRVRRFEAA